jgi:hypothetical protein
MTREQMLRKLNLIAKHCRELNAAIKEKWPDGELFYEADGVFHVLSGPSHHPDLEYQQQENIEMSSGFVNIGSGAW